MKENKKMADTLFLKTNPTYMREIYCYTDEINDVYVYE